MGRALPRLQAFPGHPVGGLPADESWLHLSCHKIFSSSKYGSAGSKWNSELITNGLNSQSHLKNSHIPPARKREAQAAAPFHASPHEGRGCVPGDGEEAGRQLPCSHSSGTVGLPHALWASVCPLLSASQPPLHPPVQAFCTPLAPCPNPLRPSNLAFFNIRIMSGALKGSIPGSRDSHSRRGRGPGPIGLTNLCVCLAGRAEKNTAGKFGDLKGAKRIEGRHG